MVVEILWVCSLLAELQVPHSVPMLYCDNVGAVLLVANPVLHSRSKHFELDLHFVPDHVAKGHVRISHIPLDVQLADIFTKAVSSPSFIYFVPNLAFRTFPS